MEKIENIIDYIKTIFYLCKNHRQWGHLIKNQIKTDKLAKETFDIIFECVMVKSGDIDSIYEASQNICNLYTGHSLSSQEAAKEMGENFPTVKMHQWPK